MTEAQFNGHVDDFDLGNHARFNNGMVDYGGVMVMSGTLGPGVAPSTVDDCIDHWNGLDDEEKQDHIDNRASNSPSSHTALKWGIGCPCEGA